MNETELERLVIRLVGDASAYEKMLEEAQRITIAASSTFEKFESEISKVGRRFSSAARSSTKFTEAVLLSNVVLNQLATSQSLDVYIKKLIELARAYGRITSSIKRAVPALVGATSILNGVAGSLSTAMNTINASRLQSSSISAFKRAIIQVAQSSPQVVVGMTLIADVMDLIGRRSVMFANSVSNMRLQLMELGREARIAQRHMAALAKSLTILQGSTKTTSRVTLFGSTTTTTQTRGFGQTLTSVTGRLLAATTALDRFIHMLLQYTATIPMAITQTRNLALHVSMMRAAMTQNMHQILNYMRQIQHFQTRRAGNQFMHLAQAAALPRISLANTAKFVQHVTNRLHSAVNAMKEFGRSANNYIVMPLTAVGAGATFEFAKFDRAMTETFARMGKQAPAVRVMMETTAKELSMSGEVSYGPTELAKAYEELGSAGLDAQQSMKSLPITAEFAQAGAFNAAQSVKLLVGGLASMNVLPSNTAPDVYAKKLERFADVAVSVANETTSSVEQVGKAFSADALTTAKQLGVTLEETAGIIGVYAMQNKDAEEAGNLTGRMLRLLTSNAVKERDAWDKLGIKVFDAKGNFVGITDAIQQLETRMKGLSTEQQITMLDMLGFETLAQKSILPLIGQSKELKRQIQVYHQHGATSKMAAIQMESFVNQMKVARNYVLVAAIEIGKLLAPSILELAERVKNVVVWFRSLDISVQEQLVTFAKYLVVVGVGLVVMGTLGQLLASSATMVSLFVTSIAWLGTALGYVLTPLGLTITGLTALAAIAAYYMNWDFGSVWQTALNRAREFSSYVQVFFEHWKENWASIRVWASQTFKRIKDGIDFITDRLWAHFGPTIKKVFKFFFPLMNQLLQDWPEVWDELSAYLSKTVGDMIASVKTFVATVIGFLMNLDVNAIIVYDWLRSNWKTILSDMLALYMNFVRSIPINMLVGVRSLVRIFSVFAGWYSSLMHKTFVSVLKGVVALGLQGTLRLVTSWAEVVWQIVRDALLGRKNMSGDKLMSELADPVKLGQQAMADVAAGANTDNLLREMGRIIGEEASKFMNPVAATEFNSIKKLPKLNLQVDTPELTIGEGVPVVNGGVPPQVAQGNAVADKFNLGGLANAVAPELAAVKANIPQSVIAPANNALKEMIANKEFDRARAMIERMDPAIAAGLDPNLTNVINQHRPVVENANKTIREMLKAGDLAGAQGFVQRLDPAIAKDLDKNLLASMQQAEAGFGFGPAGAQPKQASIPKSNVADKTLGMIAKGINKLVTLQEKLAKQKGIVLVPANLGGGS